MIKPPKRPRDANHLAKFVIDITTGKVQPKSHKASAVKGGFARSNALTSKRRSEIARLAAEARWQRKGD